MGTHRFGPARGLILARGSWWESLRSEASVPLGRGGRAGPAELLFIEIGKGQGQALGCSHPLSSALAPALEAMGKVAVAMLFPPYLRITHNNIIQCKH